MSRPRFRPQVETLEPRLPPGDTLLGALIGWSLLDDIEASLSTDSAHTKDSSFRVARRTSVAGAERSEDPHEAPTPSRIHRGVEASAPATPTLDQQPVAGAKRSEAPDEAPMPPRIHRGVEDSAPATVHKIIAGALASFPNSRSGTAVPETPFRRASSDETEFPGGAFPNGSSGTRSGADGGFSTPFYFEQNVGQADEGLDFVARGAGFTLGLSATEAIMAVQQLQPLPTQPPLSGGRKPAEDVTAQGAYAPAQKILSACNSSAATRPHR